MSCTLALPHLLHLSSIFLPRQTVPRQTLVVQSCPHRSLSGVTRGLRSPSQPLWATQNAGGVLEHPLPPVMRCFGRVERQPGWPTPSSRPDMVLGLLPKLSDIIGRLNTNNLTFTCEFAWFFLHICCNHPDRPCDLVYARRTL
jgi:hypothetical protein